jgi:hypothetical protein
MGELLLDALHGTREPYVKCQLNVYRVVLSLQLHQVGDGQAVERRLRCYTGGKPRRFTTRGKNKQRSSNETILPFRFVSYFPSQIFARADAKGT